MLKKYYIIYFLLFSIVAVAQNRVQTSVDTTQNKIGAQFNLTLKTEVDTLSNVTFPNAQQFGSLIVIRSYIVDTAVKGDRYELTKRYGLTQFDSGRYVIPQLKVVINNRSFLTDSISVEVQNVAVDTLTQKMYEIKPIIGEQSSNFSTVVEYLLIFLLILGVGALVYFLIKRQQSKATDAESLKTPIERATSLLYILEKKELWQKGEVKEYYSELTDIARNYIEEAIHIPAMESTTSELIVALRQAATQKKIKISPEILLNLEKVLKQADLVKFAKNKPLDFEIAEDRNRIEKSIITIDKAIPEIVEDDLEQKEIERQKILRQQKLKRILIPLGVVAFLLLSTITYFVATKGWIAVRDSVIGHPTKDLLEGEWVFSEYGHPGIALETPKVLKRTDADLIGKDAMAVFKEFQIFEYGSLFDNFSVAVSTLTYKQDTEIELSKIAEGVVAEFEANEMQNILVKYEESETEDGIKGYKAYGTGVVKSGNSGNQQKIYYEIIMFKQENALQQITITHEDDDEYAKQIRERILNSVELKKLSNYE